MVILLVIVIVPDHVVRKGNGITRFIALIRHVPGLLILIVM
jgi:hypothetical protein